MGFDMRFAISRRGTLLFTVLTVIASVTICGSAGAADTSSLRAQAESLMRGGRNRDALPLLDEMLKAAPDDGIALETRGLARWRALTGNADGGDDGFATIQARLCLETRPTCPEADAALSDLGRAIVLLAGPERAKALSERAQIQIRLGHDGLALPDDDEAIRLDADAAGYREDRAVLREHLGDGDGALADLDEALRLRPDAGEDLVMRAELRRRKGDVGGARADLDEALAHVPPGPPPDWLGDAHALRRAVALPSEPGMAAESSSLIVAHADLTQDATGRQAVSVTFDPASTARLAAYTSAHVGSKVEVVLDGKVILKPRILSPITGGVVVVSGNQTRDDAERLERELSAPGAALLLREAR